MATLAPIVVNDGADTPLSHTLNPIGRPSGSGWDFFVERINGVPELQNELRLRTRQPSQAGQPYRVDLTFINVDTKTVDGEEVLDNQNRVDVTFTLARGGTEQFRKDLRTMLINALDDAIVSAAVDNLENTW